MIYDHIVRREPVEKGWSGDRKYRIFTDGGGDYLLRVSPIEREERRRAEFRRMEQVAALGVPMCDPVECGVCPEGFYTILRWIDGHDAEELIPTLPPDRQYQYGLDAGQLLAKLHTLPAAPGTPDWETRFNAKIDRKIAMYEDCPLKYENGAAFLRFLSENRHLLKDRPQTYQHGDYHIGNMMIDKEGILTIIDFDRDDSGDPWEEFNRIVWCVQASPTFARGMVDGYFGGPIPESFWRLLALYISSNTLSSLPWALSFGDREIRVMREQAAQVLEWYDNMTRIVPRWYHAVDRTRRERYNHPE